MFQIDIKPDDINKAVTDAVIKSSFSEKFSVAINKALDEAMSGYDSPVKKIAKQAVIDHIESMLSTDPWKEKINTIIVKHLTNDYVEKVMGNALDKALREMRDNNY